MVPGPPSEGKGRRSPRGQDGIPYRTGGPGTTLEAVRKQIEREGSPMRALVIYESMFGNTRTIAEAIGEGLGDQLEVDVVEVNDAPELVPEDVGLLVVGGPTHVFGMSRPKTRESAVQQGATAVTPGAIGLREWLGRLAPVDPGLPAATFDTRVKRPRMPGSAARKAQRRLRRLGARIVAPAANFWVDGTPGPLLVGEANRAQQWGEALAAAMAAAAASSGDRAFDADR